MKWLVLLVLLVPVRAWAQDAGVDDAPPADAGPSADAAAPADPTAPAQGFEPPRATSSTDIPEPAGAPPHTDVIVVTVKLSVDTDGHVAKVDLLTDPQPPFDDAVIAGAKNFVFEPGRFNGAAVPVEITFTQKFQPPPPPPTPAEKTAGPALPSVLHGKLVELGTRVPVPAATITVQIDGRTYTAEGDQKGHFELPVPAGKLKITITSGGHNTFVQEETVKDKQDLGVTYLIERDRYDPYEIVVTGEQRREEVSRITLRGPEIKQIPGTFGDPFRVVQALPGVASAISLLPFPIVRGASPSSTGFLLDGTRVPLLYHLLAGPSVIHPNFIEELQFYPGGAPVEYGGYTGGIIDGRTARARSDERLVDIDVNLLQVGGMVREPVHGVTVTAAARYGYPGLILGLATNKVSLSYWDYQLRVDGGTARNGWTVFAFGSNDTLSTPAATADPADPSPPLEPSLILGFQRLDLRYHRTLGNLTLDPRVVLGYDHSETRAPELKTWVIEPSLHASWTADKTLTLNAGIEGWLHQINQGAGAATATDPQAQLTKGLDQFINGGAFIEGLWRPTPKWLIRPGVRADVYDDGETTKHSVDPRITARYVLGERDLADVPPGSDDSKIWLKGSLGVYHQPPRFVLPLPGLDLLPLRYGLLRSYQSSLGIEVPLESRFQFTGEGFFNYIDPAIFDLSFNQNSVVTSANTTLFPTSTITDTGAQDFIDRLTAPQLGRSYGMELMLRRAAKSGVFGWISYTLSRSERRRDGQWVPYDFDRTHLLNLVIGVPVARNWDVGGRLQYQSGKPETTTSGYNEARNAGYVRFDVRVDKHVVWRSWLLDFYVDVTNIALLPEEITAGNTIRYVLPTLGLRGRF